jgi:hypothetical protein
MSTGFYLISILAKLNIREKHITQQRLCFNVVSVPMRKIANSFGLPLLLQKVSGVAGRLGFARTGTM